MPLGFLVPMFAAGLLAIGVPLLLHLRRRDRQKPRPFPSLMFLNRMPVVSDRHRRIRDWPLLALRALAILLLVAAFARPFLRTGDALDTGAAGLTVLLLDRSASMAAAGIDPAWRQAADSILEQLPDGRRVAVVGFDADAVVLSRPSSDPAIAGAALAHAPPPAGATRFGAGFRAAAGLLAGERVPGEIVLVSDLQRTGRSATVPPALPAGTVVRSVVIEPTSRDNVAIVAADVEPVADGELRRAIISARLERHGGDAPLSRNVTLTIDGRELGQTSVVLPADGGGRVVFDTVTFARAAARLELRTDADGMTSDDRFVAVIPEQAATVILLVVPTDVQPDEVRYLERALAIGDAPHFVVERTTRADAAAVARSQAVILFDVGIPRDASFTTWLQDGGGLLVAVGARLARSGDLPEFIATGAHGERRRQDGALLGGLQVTHPALAALRGAGTAGLAPAQIRRFPVVDPAPGAAVLARYDDGAPALLAATLGRGRALLSAIPFGTGAGDFPLQPTYLPFLRGAVGWVAGADLISLALAAGDPWTVPTTIRSVVVRGPDGDLLRAPVGARRVTLRESGFHLVYDGRTDGVPAAVVAVNDPATESDLTAMPADELLLGVSESASPGGDLAPTDVAATREARQSGWRWLLLALLGILVVEAVIASRGWRGVALQATSGAEPQGDAG